VLKSTGNKQEPYLYGSLGGDDIPLVPAKPATAGSQVDSQSAVRRDYELALQLGTREVWEAFLRTHSDGFYAELAKGQLRRIAADEARATNDEKARLTEQEQASLVAEGAKAEIAKAAAAAKAVEEARITDGRDKRTEQEKATAAEQARLASETAAEERRQQLAAVPPKDQPDNLTADLSHALQSELRRVGCSTGPVDGNWGIASQKALDLFNKHAGMKLEVKIASANALDAVKTKSTRVCPLICETGYRSSGDKCVKVACRSGFELNDDGICVKIEVRKPVAKQDAPTARPERSQQGKTRAELQKEFVNSPTCSTARASCWGTWCASSYAKCMSTGEWYSPMGSYEGLSKR